MGRVVKWDRDVIIKAIESYRDPNKMLADCKKYKVKNEPNQRFSGDGETIQAIREVLYDLLYRYEWLGADKRYFEIIDERIQLFKDLWDESEKSRVEYLRKNGILCPKCEKGALQEFYTGKIKIESVTGGNPTHSGYQIYEFYYKQCTKCDYKKIYKYRRIPLNKLAELIGFGDDYWVWKDGDILEMFQKGQISGERYRSHEILSW